MNMAIGESGKHKAAVCINNLRFFLTILLDIFLRSDSHNLVTSYGEGLCPRLPRVDGINLRVHHDGVRRRHHGLLLGSGKANKCAEADTDESHFAKGRNYS